MSEDERRLTGKRKELKAAMTLIKKQNRKENENEINVTAR